MNTSVIDVFEFCRLKERAEGELSVAGLARLGVEAVGRAGVVNWTLVGGVDKLGHPQLTLSVTGKIDLICQRCLTAMPFQLSSESVVVLAKDEAGADAIEALLDDDVDVIVGDAAFDVTYLIEDEALLALPVAPKHDVCPAQIVPGSAAIESVSPFSALKRLKQ